MADRLGRVIAERGLELVYGAGNVGLMGILADAALAAGGRVIGVIPSLLVDMEVAHDGLTELHVVNSMHERKELMLASSDAFVAMPGGFGTLDELFEVLTHGQLGFHHKPCGVLNVGGFFDQLLLFLDFMVSQEFVKPIHRDMLIVDESPENLLNSLARYEAPHTDKWISRD
jgi:hypothetical protein